MKTNKKILFKYRKPARNSHSSAPQLILKRRLPHQHSLAISSNRSHQRQLHDQDGRPYSVVTHMSMRTRDLWAIGYTWGGRVRRVQALSIYQPTSLRLRAPLREAKRNKQNGRKELQYWRRGMLCHSLRLQ